uniref:50S ribosomal protein L28 n=2 Tax=Proboscia inermis TaxID=420281 RepID=A0A7S0BYI3_9STRA|mmetsp:Transcript_10170/g.11641  ORF Transcript_10170/g.11641 Transcript_10170/m.11641 type:complete len:127 (-) Transcript_10170:200-580(-)
MKSFLFVAILVTLLASFTHAFGVGTPLAPTRAVSEVRSTRGNNMVMRTRVCDLLGKKANRKARVVTFSNKRIHKVQEVNLQWKKYFSEELKRNVRLRLSTKGMKTVNKYGSIDAAAKKFGVELKKF